jgi:hypothetical protein
VKAESGTATGDTGGGQLAVLRDARLTAGFAEMVFATLE